jgi:hypothetical protein
VTTKIKLTKPILNDILSPMFFFKSYNLYYFVLIGLFACRNPNNEKVQHDQHQIFEGKFDSDSLEVGHWKYLDKASLKVVEEGLYSQGLRTDSWKYYSPDSFTIDWREYSNANLSIRMNVPVFLTLSEQENNGLKFIHKDSSNAINLLIGKNFLGDSLDFDSYRKTVIQDLVSRQVNIVDTTSRVFTTEGNRRYLFNFLFAESKAGKQYYLLSVLGNSAKREPIEIILRCEPHYLTISRKVFFSVVTNIFIDSKRFFPVKEGMLLHED